MYKRLLRLGFVLMLAYMMAGCFYFGKDQYEDVLLRPSSEWSSRDALTVLAASMGSNLFDQRINTKVTATPYYPSVITAIQRSAQRLNHWSEEEFRSNTEALMKDDLGMYVDWEKGQCVDSRGNYFRDKLQLDSLMFLITINNTAWPCNSMMAVFGGVGSIYAVGSGSTAVMIPVVSPEDCYIPDISHLENQIFLVNDRNQFIHPKYVWGRRHDVLTMEETLFAMFVLRNQDYHFLHGSENMYLVVKGFERDIKLKFPLSMIQ